jgi:hypothetical protein
MIRMHKVKKLTLFALTLTVAIGLSSAYSQTPLGTTATSPVPQSSQSTNPKSQAAKTASVSGYHAGMPSRARTHYATLWGIDDMKVRSVNSGELIRFDFRVIDAIKAKPLNDKQFEPYLIDQTSGVKLVIPTLEKVGQLRQVATPEVDKVYWMAFSNRGGHVKSGDWVTVVIGNFHADGLVVE